MISNAHTVFFLDGPSGAGKTTIVEAVAARLPELRFVPRYTTRQPRPGLVESEYHFVSADAFQRMAAAGEFVEFRHYEFGMSYGLPRRPIEDAIQSGHHALGIVNLGQVAQAKKLFPRGVSILIHVPLTVIEERLHKRSTHTAAQISERLNNARETERLLDQYDEVLENSGPLESTVAAVVNVVKGWTPARYA